MPSLSGVIMYPFVSLTELFFRNYFHRTLCCAGSALDTFVWIDYISSFSLRNCAHWTLCCASSTFYTSLVNYICHTTLPAAPDAGSHMPAGISPDCVRSKSDTLLVRPNPLCGHPSPSAASSACTAASDHPPRLAAFPFLKFHLTEKHSHLRTSGALFLSSGGQTADSNLSFGLSGISPGVLLPGMFGGAARSVSILSLRSGANAGFTPNSDLCLVQTARTFLLRAALFYHNFILIAISNDVGSKRYFDPNILKSRPGHSHISLPYGAARHGICGTPSG